MSMNSKPTQCDRILLYMKENKSITPLDAMREFGCMRLAARIHELKDQGHNISETRQANVNRYGEKVRFCRYYLED